MVCLLISGGNNVVDEHAICSTVASVEFVDSRARQSSKVLLHEPFQCYIDMKVHNTPRTCTIYAICALCALGNPAAAAVIVQLSGCPLSMVGRIEYAHADMKRLLAALHRSERSAAVESSA